MNLIESPILPGVPLMMGWAAPVAVHLLGLAIAVTVALHLSRHWWRPFVATFGDRPEGPGYSLWLALVALAGAYALEYAFYLVLNVPIGKWLLESLYRPARVTDYLLTWLIHAARMLPYLLAAVLVPLFSRPRRPGLRLGGGAESWAAARPAFLVLVPWAVVLILVWAFPASSAYTRMAAGSLIAPAAGMFIMNILFMPFFFGVLTPAIIGALTGVFGRKGGSEGREGSIPRVGLKLAGLALGVAITLVWALVLPRPGLAATGTAAAGLPLQAYIYYAFIYLIAASVQERDRNVVWGPLAVAAIAFGVSLVKSLLGLAFTW